MINELIDKGELILDIEFGNQHDFFSGSKRGYCNASNYENKKLNRILDVEIPEAQGNVEEEVIINGDCLWRNLNFISKGDSFLFDFVSRYVVFSNRRNAYISNIKIEHNNSNIYYQHSADAPVKVPLGDDYWLKFSDVGSSIERYFDNVFYIRDESQIDGRCKWVVHHRKIVKAEYAELILRGCHPKIEGVLPYQRCIPKRVKKALFRIRERKYPYCPLMTVGIVNVKGSQLKLTTEVRLTKDD